MNLKRNKDSPWRAAGLVGVMGLDIAVCMLAGYFVARRLSDSQGWVVMGILVGLAVGILSCVFLVKKVLEDNSDG